MEGVDVVGVDGVGVDARANEDVDAVVVGAEVP